MKWGGVVGHKRERTMDADKVVGHIRERENDRCPPQKNTDQRLRDEELPVVVQQAVQPLQHLGGRQVQLVEDEPVVKV